MQLSAARPGRDHKAIEDTRLPRQIDHDDILAFVLSGNLGSDFGRLDTIGHCLRRCDARERIGLYHTEFLGVGAAGF
jgi:hypothetical protein